MAPLLNGLHCRLVHLLTFADLLNKAPGGGGEAALTHSLSGAGQTDRHPCAQVVVWCCNIQDSFEVQVSFCVQQCDSLTLACGGVMAGGGEVHFAVQVGCCVEHVEAQIVEKLPAH